jgi:probable HAF family extracellular repeat protein
VVGYYSWNDQSRHSFIYRGGALHDLGTIKGYDNCATAINNYGQTVGYFQLEGNLIQPEATDIPYLHASNGTITNLGALGGRPTGINDSGVIAGTDGNTNQGFIYRNGTLTYLGSYNGRPLFNAESINNRGQVVAQYLLPVTNGSGVVIGSVVRTVLYNGGQTQDIGIPSGATNVMGYAINNRGVILGEYFTSSGGSRGFLWSDGKFQDIGDVQMHSFSAINDSGQLVGYRPITTGYGRVAIVSTGTQDQDLNSLIDPNAHVNLIQVDGINAWVK